MLKDAEEPAVDSADSVNELAHTEELEALFSVAEIRTLQLASRHCNPSVSDFLAHQVARNPADLRRHVQRISFFLNKGDGPRVYGALMDLFIGLGRKGIKLRRRMLATARPLLSRDQSRALEDKLQSGLSPLDRVPLSSESILGKGIRGATRLLERSDEDGHSGQDLLEEARSRLEYGQVEEARRVLEEAVLEDPLRDGLHKELLEIYVHSQDHEQFGAMLQALRFAGSPIPPAWQRFAADLGLDDGG